MEVPEATAAESVAFVPDLAALLANDRILASILKETLGLGSDKQDRGATRARLSGGGPGTVENGEARARATSNESPSARSFFPDDSAQWQR